MTATLDLQTVNMAEVGEEVLVTEKDKIEIPTGDHLIIGVPVEYGTGAAKFTHPNIVAVKKSILEFKHYHPIRGKFWTSKPGMIFYFVVPKNEIEIVKKCGLSYVDILIRGEKYTLNIGGGSAGSGWTDFIRQGSQTLIYKTAKQLKAIAEASISYIPEYLDFKLRVESEEYIQRYKDLCATQICMKKLGVGDKIVLKSFYNICKSQGPFEIYEKPKNKKRYYVKSQYNDTANCTYKYIDWVKTAEANGIDLSNV